MPMLTWFVSIGPGRSLTDNAYVQGKMTAEVVGFSFAPASQVSTPNGLLTFGGTDASQFTGAVQFECVSPLQWIEYQGFDS